MESSRFEQYARIAVIVLLAVGTLLVIAPFLAAILFAVILCMSTWPAFAWLRTKLGGRSSLAALVFVLGLLIVIALPVAVAANSLVVHSGEIIEGARNLLDRRESIELPSAIKNLPIVGPTIDGYWHSLKGSREELVALARRLAEPAKDMAVAMGQAAGTGLLQVLLAIFVAFFFYRDGELAVGLFRSAVLRLAGSERGEMLVTTAKNTIKGVVYGLIGTAAAQAFVALIGFWIAGVPGAILLAALTFILSLVPMGPVLIWGGAAAYLYSQGETGWAIFMVVYGLVIISSVDNFVKPILMSRAGGLSMLIVVLGVFGGAIAFGLIGLFVGPVLLAVSWSLIKAWLESRAVPAPEAP